MSDDDDSPGIVARLQTQVAELHLQIAELEAESKLFWQRLDETIEQKMNERLTDCGLIERVYPPLQVIRGGKDDPEPPGAPSAA
jgi:hypothetical protein